MPSVGTDGIEAVRAKFDPMAKKIPAHVTLIFPEPANLIDKELLKNVATAELPKLESVVFSEVVVREEMYLWLLPDEESRGRFIAWREAYVGKLTEHSQEEAFIPHLTLGYIPRSITPEDALTFAKQHVSLPVILNFDKILLEEFAENQISSSLDTLPLT